jgi:CheY-like chemotaxis protein
VQGGADAFLTKPVREDELLAKMGSLLNIAYDYEEVNADEPVAGAPALRADRLRQLPPELLEGIRDATMAGNKSLLGKLIGKVRETGDAESARALQEFADNYEYDALTQLLEESRSL